MQEMLDSNQEKAKIEASIENQKLQNQIAELKTELAKSKTCLSETSATADSVGDMKETLKVMEQKFDDKVKEMMEIQSRHDVLKATLEEKEREISDLND